MAKEPPVEPGTIQPTAVTDEGLSLHSYFQEFKAESSPPLDLYQQIMARAPQPPALASKGRAPWSWLAGWLPGLATAATICLACVIWLRPIPHTGTQRLHSATSPQSGKSHSNLVPQRQVHEHGFVPKGDVVLTLLHSRKTPQGHTYKQTTRGGAVLSEGDLVQLQYHVRRPTYVMMLSLNQQGEVSLFVPFGQEQSIRVTKGQGYLPQTGSLELDGYQGHELFVLLSSTRAFSVKAARAALQKAYRRDKRRWHTMRHLAGPWQAQLIAVRKKKAHR